MMQQSNTTFAGRLRQLQRTRRSFLCVGIDPEPDRLPPKYAGDRDGLYKFCQLIIRATMQYAVAFKFNLAFFEVLGNVGWDTLARLLRSLPDDCITIADAKRGDIGNSARHYATSIFDNFGFDAVTINPYMGFDAAEPFLAYREKGIFFLCLTSNPGAADLQYRLCDGKPLFLHVAELVQRWNEAGNCGLVVGATQAKPLQKICSLCPELPLLIPGIGAQGGKLESVLKIASKATPLISASRSILYADESEAFAQGAAYEAASLQAKMAPYCT